MGQSARTRPKGLGRLWLESATAASATGAIPPSSAIATISAMSRWCSPDPRSRRVIGAAARSPPATCSSTRRSRPIATIWKARAPRCSTCLCLRALPCRRRRGRPIHLLAWLCERDPARAAEAFELMLIAGPEAMDDWPDLLAADCLEGRPFALADWARSHGLALATVSRGSPGSMGSRPPATAPRRARAAPGARS